MGNREILLDYISANPGLDDDELSRTLAIKPRQQVNAICRKLERSGYVIRQIGPNGKLCNHPADSASVAAERRSWPARQSTAAASELAMIEILAAEKGWELGKRNLRIAQRARSFDFVSPDRQIVGDDKSGTGLTSGGNRASAKISDAVATAHALDQVEGAAIRFLAFSDQHLFRFVLADLTRHRRRHSLLLIQLDLGLRTIVDEVMLSAV